MKPDGKMPCLFFTTTPVLAEVGAAGLSGTPHFGGDLALPPNSLGSISSSPFGTQWTLGTGMAHKWAVVSWALVAFAYWAGPLVVGQEADAALNATLAGLNGTNLNDTGSPSPFPSFSTCQSSTGAEPEPEPEPAPGPIFSFLMLLPLLTGAFRRDRGHNSVRVRVVLWGRD